MSFLHEQREAWTLGRDDLGKTIKVSGSSWTFVGVLKKVDVNESVMYAARDRFPGNTNHLAVAVWVGPFTGAIPARALVVVEHEIKEDELKSEPSNVLEGVIVRD